MEVTPVPVPGPRGPVNCYIARSGDEALLVDAGPDPEARAVLDALDRLGLKLRRVALTHTHLNHLRGAGAVVEATGAELCVSATEGFHLEHWEPLARRRSRPPPPRPPGRGPPGRAPPPPLAPLGGDPSELLSLRPPEPGRLLRDGDGLEVGDERLTARFTPGHSVGHLCFEGAGLLFSGDLLPGEGMPSFGPRPGEMADGNATSLLRSLASLSGPGERTLYPGHGPPGGGLGPRLAEVARTLDRWEATLREALRRERRGRSLSDLAALLGPPGDPLLLSDAAALLEKLVLDRRVQRRGDLYFGPRA